jgi:ABC-type transport system involved in cytochrome bd biosynthesis fused ATPase/permease subunit
MKGAARRLVRLVPAARRAVSVTAGLSIVAALLVVAQAGLLADLVSRAFLGDAGVSALTPALIALAAVVVARAVLGWAQEGGESPSGGSVVA